MTEQMGGHRWPGDGGGTASMPAVPIHSSAFGGDPAALAETARHDAAVRLAVPADLFDLAQLDCHYDHADATLWTYMRPNGRPSFNPDLLVDFLAWQDLIGTHFGPDRVPLDFLVLGSRVPGVFCYGGDLDLFAALITAGDRDGLVAYGRACVEILHRNMLTLDLPMVTIGLVQGDALGGGWEALMSFNVIIAERGTRFALPESSFGLFPGMGAHAILSRKLGTAAAERMILDGRGFSAEELFELGLVHRLAEPGQGVAAVQEFIRRERRHLAGRVGAHRAMRMAAPIALNELVDIVTLWADTALKLTGQDLRLMQRLVAAQTRRAGPASAAA